MHPSHSFEYDLPTQGQGSQGEGSQQLHLPQRQVAKQGLAGPTAARSGVMLVEQHAPARDGRGSPRPQSANQTQPEGRKETDDHQYQQQQQQQLVSWGALGPADAAKAHAAGVVGQTASSASGGTLQTLQELHQQPPWAGLTVGQS